MRNKSGTIKLSDKSEEQNENSAVIRGTRQGAIKETNELENFPQFLSPVLHSDSTSLHINPTQPLTHDAPEPPLGQRKRPHDEHVFTEFLLEMP